MSRFFWDKQGDVWFLGRGPFVGSSVVYRDGMWRTRHVEPGSDGVPWGPVTPHESLAAALDASAAVYGVTGAEIVALEGAPTAEVKDE